MSLLLPAAVLLPLLLALLRAVGLGTAGRAWLLVLAPLPLLLLALLPSGRLELPHLLLGMSLANHGLGQVLALLAGLAWLLAGRVAAATVTRRRRLFDAAWLGSLGGLAWATLAGDLIGFYSGYALMTVSAYGLVIHAGTAEALRAGRVYLVMAILAEGAVLAGVLLVAAATGALELDGLVQAPVDAGPLAGWLLLAGFGVKMGLAGLHLWLPVAHPVAPVPASAVLSGVIVKAGLLGLVRLLPEAMVPAAAPGVLLGLGLFTAFYGVAMGLPQTRAKTVLAYSTVSQMGLLAMLAGLALLPGGREALWPVLGLLVLHHGLNKAALFLAAGQGRLVGAWPRLLFALPALALAAAPLGSGMLAKGALKAALASGGYGAAWLLALSLGSAATALLLWRAFGLLADAGEVRQRRSWVAWAVLVALGAVVPWGWALAQGLGGWPGPSTLWDGLWPLVLAAAGLWCWRRLGRPGAGWAGRVPEGDLLGPVERGLAALRGAVARRLPGGTGLQPPAVSEWLAGAMGRGERGLAGFAAAGLAVLLLVLAAGWLLRAWA
ncbi:MAG: proton-conducting transporter transmembrane domain-containing protein [Lysobacteraceae bacterium]